MNDHTFIAATLLLVTLCACDKKESEPTTPDEKPAEPVVATTPTKPIEETKPEDEAKPEEDAPKEEDIPMEVDPSATEGLENIDFTGKLLETDDQIKDSYKGEIVESVSWQDKYGTSVFVITSSPNKKGGGLLVASHLTRSGDGSWETIREYKELVKECEFDLMLTPQLDEKWSLTDLDKDGLAEVTFAWTAGCTSDVSPNPYKVLMDEHGEKYALRGNTKIIMTKDDQVGGDYEVGKEFDKAPEGFLDHAKMVWNKTHIVDYTQPR